MTRALITGAAGQDGVLLSQQLLADGYDVVGLIKPGTSAEPLERYAPEATVIECELGEVDEVTSTVVDVAPDEVYNLGGVSSIMESVNHPELTHRVNVGAVEAILTAMDILAPRVECRLVQAASGTIFEGTEVSPQDELTPRSPHTPYAQAKAETMDLIAHAREERGRFATAAILYNHESPLRGNGFVTRRITEGAARIAAGLADVLELGNLDVCRDWGWAPDYVRGMRLMLAAPTPQDYVLATGEVNLLTDFLRLAFTAAGIDDWTQHVRTRDDLRRTTDPSVLRGDSSKAYRELGWQHTRTFAQIAEEMVRYDLRLLEDPQALWHES